MIVLLSHTLQLRRPFLTELASGRSFVETNGQNHIVSWRASSLSLKFHHISTVLRSVNQRFKKFLLKFTNLKKNFCECSRNIVCKILWSFSLNFFKILISVISTRSRFYTYSKVLTFERSRNLF